MKRISKIALAAGVLFVLIGVSALLVPRDEAIDFSDVAHTLTTIRSATWNMTTETELAGKKRIVLGKGMFLEPSRERLEMTVQGTAMHTVSDAAQGKMITLLPSVKLAEVVKVKGDSPTDMPASTFQRLRQIVSDAQAGQDTEIVSLPDDTLDGQAVIGFQIHQGVAEIKLWADRETASIVRVDYTTGVDASAMVVMDNFKVNIDLDESLFSLEIPADYTIRGENAHAMQQPSVEDLAKSLHTVATSNNNIFPAELRGENGMEGAMSGYFAMLKAQNDGNLPQTEEANEAFAVFGRCMAFLGNLADENEWTYVGGDVKLDTPDTPIFWYKPSGSEQYRAIWADTSVSDMRASDLPQVE